VIEAISAFSPAVSPSQGRFVVCSLEEEVAERVMKRDRVERRAVVVVASPVAAEVGYWPWLRT